MNQEQKWVNPSHPVDLSIDQIDEIKEEFEKFALLSQDNQDHNNQLEGGMPIDIIVHKLSIKLKQEPNILKKILQRIVISKKVTWSEFQQLLINEINSRENLLQWYMFGIQTKRFQVKQELNLFPKGKKTERTFYIEFFQEIIIHRQIYFLIIFDDCSISLFEPASMRILFEFKIVSKLDQVQIMQQAIQKHSRMIKSSQNRRIRTQLSEDSQGRAQIDDNDALKDLSITMSRSVQQRRFLLKKKAGIDRDDDDEQPNQSELNDEINNNYFEIDAISQYRNESAFTEEDLRGFITQQKPSLGGKKKGIRSYYKLAGQMSNSRSNQFKSSSRERIKTDVSTTSIQYNRKQESNSLDKSAISLNKYIQQLDCEQPESINNISASDISVNQFFSVNKNTAIDNSNPERQVQRSQIGKSNLKWQMSRDLRSQSQGKKQQSSRIVKGDSKENVTDQLKNKKEQQNIEAMLKEIKNNMKKPFKYTFVTVYSVFVKILHFIKTLRRLVDKSNKYCHNQLVIMKNKQSIENLQDQLIQERKYERKNQDVVSKIWQQFKEISVADPLQKNYVRAVNSIIKEKQLDKINMKNLSIISQSCLSWQNKQQQQKSLSNGKGARVQKTTSNIMNISSSNNNDLNPQLKSSTSCKKQTTTETDQFQLPPPRMDRVQDQLRKMKIIKAQLNYNPNLKIDEFCCENPAKRDISADTFNYGSKGKSPIIKKFNYKTKIAILATSVDDCHQLFCTSLVTREIHFFNFYFYQESIRMHRLQVLPQAEIVQFIHFHFNQIKQKWHLVLYYADSRVLKSFAYTYQEKSMCLTIEQQPNFIFQFIFAVDFFRYFSDFGFVATSFQGDLLILMDKLSIFSKQSSQNCEHYQVFYETRLEIVAEQKTTLKVSALNYSTKTKLIVFGTLDGQVGFLDIYTQEKPQVLNASKKDIIGIHIFEQQSQAIAITSNNYVIIFDMNSKQRVYQLSIGTIKKGHPFYAAVSCSHFCAANECLYTSSNQFFVLAAVQCEDLQFQKKKNELLFKWRQIQLNKQQKQQEMIKQPKSKIVDDEDDDNPCSIDKNFKHHQNQKEPQKDNFFIKKQQSLLNSGVPQLNLGPKVIPSEQISSEHHHGEDTFLYSNSSNQPKTKLLIKRNKEFYQNYEEVDSTLVEQVFQTKLYYIILYQSREVKMLKSENLDIKYSTMVSVNGICDFEQNLLTSHLQHTITTSDQGRLDIIYIAISERYLAILLQSGKIILKNIFTDHTYQTISDYPDFPLKIKQAYFLPDECDYLLAVTTDEGKLALIASQIKDTNSSKKCIHKVLNVHSKPICAVVFNTSFLATAGEEGKISIFSLSSCCKKFEFAIPGADEKTNFIQSLLFLKSKPYVLLCLLDSGVLHEINVAQGKFIAISACKLSPDSLICVDYQDKMMIAVNPELDIIKFYQRNEERISSKKQSKKGQTLQIQGITKTGPSPTSKISGSSQQQQDHEKKSKHNKQSILIPNIDNSIWTQVHEIPLKQIIQTVNVNRTKPLSILYSQANNEYNIFLSRNHCLLVNAENYLIRVYNYEKSQVDQVIQQSQNTGNSNILLSIEQPALQPLQFNSQQKSVSDFKSSHRLAESSQASETNRNYNQTQLQIN